MELHFGDRMGAAEAFKAAIPLGWAPQGNAVALAICVTPQMALKLQRSNEGDVVGVVPSLSAVKANFHASG